MKLTWTNLFRVIALSNVFGDLRFSKTNYHLGKCRFNKQLQLLNWEHNISIDKNFKNFQNIFLKNLFEVYGHATLNELHPI